MKKLIKKVHLILALCAGLFIFLLSISGALLSFGKEIQASVNPSSWTIAAPKPPLALPQLLEKMEIEATASHTTLKSISMTGEPTKAWNINLNNGEQWNINPSNGDILDRFQKGDDFYSWVLYFHRWLLVNENPQRGWVRQLISIASTIFMVQIIFGLYLWLTPKKRALKRLKLSAQKTTTAKLTHWHLVAGVYCSLPLLLIAYTGIGFNWPIVGKLVEWSTSSNIQRSKDHAPVTVGGTALWKDSLFKAQAALADGQLRRIYFPQGSDKPMVFRFLMPSEFHPASYVWVDAGRAEIIGQFNSQKASLATRVWNFKFPFHTGEFFGKITKSLWLLLSALPAFFVVSGLWLYWNRRLKQKKATLKKRPAQVLAKN